jgi:hypothetical protein
MLMLLMMMMSMARRRRIARGGRSVRGATSAQFNDDDVGVGEASVCARAHAPRRAFGVGGAAFDENDDCKCKNSRLLACWLALTLVGVKLVETPENNQHTPFEFSEENKLKVKQIIAKYPPGNQKSAVMPLLDLAQRCERKKKKKKTLTLNTLES